MNSVFDVIDGLLGTLGEGYGVNRSHVPLEFEKQFQWLFEPEQPTKDQAIARLRKMRDDLNKPDSFPYLLGRYLRHMLSVGDAQYCGPCVLNSVGAWTRCGPTFRLSNGVFLVVGPGVRNWNTTKGLAEIATNPEVVPTWHALGGSLVPSPTIVVAYTPGVMTAQEDNDVARLTKECEAFYGIEVPE